MSARLELLRVDQSLFLLFRIYRCHLQKKYHELQNPSQIVMITANSENVFDTWIILLSLPQTPSSGDLIEEKLMLNIVSTPSIDTK